MAIHTQWKGELTSIVCDEQHISRLRYSEVRDLVCQILVFGPKQLRQDIKAWLDDGKIASVANFIGDKES